MITLETKRMILRDFAMDDAEDVYAYAQSPNVGPRAGWGPHQSIEQTHEVLLMFIKEQEVWAIVDKASNKVIGSLGLHKNSLRAYETARSMGYVLAEEFWGQGRMAEAGQKVLEYAFEQMGMDIIQICHFDTNMQSKRVIEKLGYTFEGILRKQRKLFDGSFQDAWYYSMTKDEYTELKK